MDEPLEPAPSPPLEAPVDLRELERIEAELQAVERALEQIDQGVYEGFAGLEPRPAPTPQTLPEGGAPGA